MYQVAYRCWNLSFKLKLSAEIHLLNTHSNVSFVIILRNMHISFFSKLIQCYLRRHHLFARSLYSTSNGWLKWQSNIFFVGFFFCCCRFWFVFFKNVDYVLVCVCKVYFCDRRSRMAFFLLVWIHRYRPVPHIQCNYTVRVLMRKKKANEKKSVRERLPKMAEILRNCILRLFVYKSSWVWFDVNETGKPLSIACNNPWILYGFLVSKCVWLVSVSSLHKYYQQKPQTIASNRDYCIRQNSPQSYACAWPINATI